MARLFHVSIPSSEKELIDFIEKKQKERAFTPSSIFRDAMRELKMQDDILSMENLETLKKKLNNWKGLVEKQKNFIIEKGLIDEFLQYEDKEVVDFKNVNIEK